MRPRSIPPIIIFIFCLIYAPLTEMGLDEFYVRDALP